MNKERLHVWGIVLVRGTYKTFSMPFPNTLDPDYEHTLTSILIKRKVFEPPKRVLLQAPSMNWTAKV